MRFCLLCGAGQLGLHCASGKRHPWAGSAALSVACRCLASQRPLPPWLPVTALNASERIYVHNARSRFFANELAVVSGLFMPVKHWCNQPQLRASLAHAAAPLLATPVCNPVCLCAPAAGQRH